MHFSSHFSQGRLASSFYQDCPISLSNEVKDLGDTLDRHLTFKTHINNICRSALDLFITSEKLGTFYLDVLRKILFMHLFLQNWITRQQHSSQHTHP